MYPLWSYPSRRIHFLWQGECNNLTCSSFFKRWETTHVSGYSTLWGNKRFASVISLKSWVARSRKYPVIWRICVTLASSPRDVKVSGCTTASSCRHISGQRKSSGRPSIGLRKTTQCRQTRNVSQRLAAPRRSTPRSKVRRCLRLSLNSAARFARYVLSSNARPCMCSHATKKPVFSGPLSYALDIPLNGCRREHRSLHS